MKNQLIQKKVSDFEGLIERFANIKEKYGDEYPIVLYEPEIGSEEKKALKELTERDKSIYLFVEFKQAFNFVQQLGIGFILITSSDFDEKIVLKNFQGLQNTFGSQMLDFEEKTFWESLFGEISVEKIKSLQVKAYVFFTLLEFKIDPPEDVNEEEVMIMRELKDMANDFRQEFTVIWYDPNASPKDKEKLEKEVDIEENNIYKNFDELERRLSNSAEPSYHLILTGKDEAEKIIQKIEDFQNLLCLYIYYDDPELAKIKNNKIIVQKNFDELIPKIIEGIRTNSKLTNTFPAFATHFDALDKSHTFNLHYYLQGLINFKNRKQAKRDFVNLATKIYQSKRIFEFENDYNDYDKDKILTWYTRESPVYKVVNNCLRIATSDSILYCRYILKDLEKAISEQYKKESKKYNGPVYRGAYITEEEWQKLQGNIGKEIEMYGFLSTSKNMQTAKNFLYKDLKNKVLVTIIIPPFPMPDLNEQGFADISQISQFDKESEILFNVRSKFQILELSIAKIDSKGTECRHLVLMYGTHLLRKFMTENKPSLRIELELPLELKCMLCGSIEKLFGFKQDDQTGVHCMKCLGRNSTPKDVVLLPLEARNDGNENKAISKIFEGKILAFNKMDSFPYYGYKCHTCQVIGKERYYKWFAINGDEIFEQCSDCFEAEKQIASSMLIMEEYPYYVWRGHQAEWEKVDSSYQMELSTLAKYKDQSNVFNEVQRFDLCILYGEKTIRKIHKNRRRESKKLTTAQNLACAHAGLGDYQRTILYLTPLSAENTKAFSMRIFYAQLFGVGFSAGNKNKFTGISILRSSALRGLKKKFKILRAIYGDLSGEGASSSYNLAAAYAKLKVHQRALKYCNKALDMKIAIYGENHPLIIDLYSLLAGEYQQLETNQKAFEYYEKALRLAIIFYGKNHPETASIIHNFAIFLQDGGNYQQAQMYFEKGLEIGKSIFGEKHPHTALSYSQLGILHFELGDYQKAMDFERKALDICKSIHSETHPDTASIYHNIALVYRTYLNQPKQALEYHHKALNIYKVNFGEINHPNIAHSYHNIACAHGDLGEHQKELEYSQKGLDMRKSIYGENHSDTAESYSGFAAACAHLREPKQALESVAKARSIMEGIYREHHPSMANLYFSLVKVFLMLKQHQEALTFSLKALEIGRTFFGERHPKMAISFFNLGLVHQILRAHQKALEYYNKTLDIQKVIYGEEHQDYAFLYHNIALMYQHLGKLPKALEYYRKCLKIRIIIYGEKHPENARFYHDLGKFYSGLGRQKKATEYFQKAQLITKEDFGDHFEITGSRYVSFFSFNSLNYQNTMKTSQTQEAQLLQKFKRF